MDRHNPKASRSKAPGQRQLRIGEEIRHALARIFERDTLRDPALANVRLTVTEVRPSPDLRHARVYVVPLGGGKMDAILEGLQRVRPYLRREMASQLQIRYIPDLSFAADNSFDEAAHILTLLHKPEVARDLRAPDADETPADETAADAQDDGADGT